MDEFDSMCNEKSTPLSERLGISTDQRAGLFATHRDEQKQEKDEDVEEQLQVNQKEQKTDRVVVRRGKEEEVNEWRSDMNI